MTNARKNGRNGMAGTEAILVVALVAVAGLLVTTGFGRQVKCVVKGAIKVLDGKPFSMDCCMKGQPQPEVEPVITVNELGLENVDVLSREEVTDGPTWSGNPAPAASGCPTGGATGGCGEASAPADAVEWFVEYEGTCPR